MLCKYNGSRDLNLSALKNAALEVCLQRNLALTPYFCTNQLCGCFINRRWLQSLHQIQVSMAFMIYLKFATSALKDAAELRLILKMFLSLKSSRF